MPSARAITRSSWSEFSNVLSPRMTSLTTIAPSSATRSRTAPSPSSSPRKPRLPCCSCHALICVLARRGAVREAVVEQLLHDLGVALAALGLEHRLLVPVELEPAQGVEDLLDVLGGRALAVGVLDPEQELAAAATGQQPVVQCRPRTPDVQGARRRRSESHAHLDTACHEARASRSHAHRRTRLPRRWPRKGGGARRGTRLRRDPDLQPEPARVAAARVLGGGGRRVPGRDGGLAARGADDPRGLPVELRLRGSRDPREVADRADRGAPGGRGAGRALRGAAPRLRSEGRGRPGAGAGGGDDRRGAGRVRDLPAAPRGHRRLRGDARALVRGAGDADRGGRAATSASACAWTPATCWPPATTCGPRRG